MLQLVVAAPLCLPYAGDGRLWAALDPRRRPPLLHTGEVGGPVCEAGHLTGGGGSSVLLPPATSRRRAGAAGGRGRQVVQPHQCAEQLPAGVVEFVREAFEGGLP